VLANAIATIDHLSGGRAALGLGAGWHQTEYNAYGIPFPSAGVRLAQLDEAAQCARGLLRDEMTTFEGEYFQLHNAECDPRPVQSQLPIWIGGGGERKTLRTVAKWADGWNVPFVSPEEFARKRQVLLGHCEDVGRDPAEITKTRLGPVNIAATQAEAERNAERVAEVRNIPPEAAATSFITGDPDTVLEKVEAFLDAGLDGLLISLPDAYDLEPVELAGRTLAGRLGSATAV